MLAGAYYSKLQDQDWNASADLNHDDTIDILGAILLADNYGKHPRCTPRTLWQEPLSDKSEYVVLVKLGSLKDFFELYVNPFKEWRLQFIGWLGYALFVQIFILLGTQGLRKATAMVSVGGYFLIYFLLSYLPWIGMWKYVITPYGKTSPGGMILHMVLGLIPLLLFLFAVVVYWSIFPVVP